MQTFSAITIRDPRVSEEHNATFLDMMEDYFSQSTEVKEKDARPDIGYQVGVTPENKEVPRCGRDEGCKELVEKVMEGECAMSCAQLRGALFMFAKLDGS